MFPDGTYGVEIGSTESTDQRLAALGGGGGGPAVSALADMPTELQPTSTPASEFGDDWNQYSSLAPAPTPTVSPPAPVGLTALAAPTTHTKVACPGCGKSQAFDGSPTAHCSSCGASLQQTTLAIPSDLPSFSLNLADDTPDKVKCPICKTSNDWANKACSKCHMSLEPAKKKLMNASADAGEEMVLHLTSEQLAALDLAPKQAQRDEWSKKGLALSDGSWPIPDVSYLRKAIQAWPGRASGKEDAIKAWIMKRAKALNFSGSELDKLKSSSTNAAQPEHMATVMALQLEHTAGAAGLIWKVLCKTGTLALSPGPGQVDVDKPLNLTSDLFAAVKHAYDDRAFEHVTIPETHANGTLENTGTVDHLDILTKDQALADTRLSQKSKDTFVNDPTTTLYMLGGLHFTDPKVREKAANGSILNCSVGLKFNYRNKRTGKVYPAALEHTALTNQPWVDGLGAFGAPAQLSAPFDQDQLPTWDGVFGPQDGGGSSTPSLPTPVPASTLLQAMQPRGGTPTQTPAPAPTVTPTPAAPAAPEGPTLEMVLAQQTAEIERLRREADEGRAALTASQETLRDQGRTLHLTQTSARVAELQAAGIPPSVLTRYQALRLAAFDADDSGQLQLSVTQGESTTDVTMGPVEIAEYLIAGIPRGEGADAIYSATAAVGADVLQLTQKQTEKLELTAEQKADAVEKQLHPERFDAEGKRLSAESRHPAQPGKAA